MKILKRAIILAAISLIMVFCLIACSSNVPADEATLPAQETKQQTVDPVDSENSDGEIIKNVVIDLSNRGITDMQLFEMIASNEIHVNVINLNLSGNKISDLTPLNGLTNLNELDLMNNPLTYRAVHGLRRTLPNCEIKFKSEWTVYVNGEEIEIDVVDTDNGPFIPLDVLRLFNYEISYMLEEVSEQGIAPFIASASRIRRNYNDYYYGGMYYDDFIVFYDGSKYIIDYDFNYGDPMILEFDGIKHFGMIYFFLPHDLDEDYSDGRPIWRRDGRTLWFEGETDPLYEYLPRPRPTHWRLFINDEEMPIEVLQEPGYYWSDYPSLSIYVIEFFDLYDVEYEYVYKWNADVVNIEGQELLLSLYAAANDRNRYGSVDMRWITQPQYTLNDLESGVFGQSGNWGVTSVTCDEYEWIVRLTSTWLNPGSLIELISIEDLPPLVIAPQPPPVPDIESGFEAFYRQRDEQERTNRELAEAISSGEIPADTTSLWIRLWGDNISDLSPLAELKNLKALRISDTQVSDLSPLAGLQNLQAITIERSPVSDLSPLVGMPSLREIHIEGVSSLKDISPVSEMTNLTHLGLVSTQVKDISPIRALTNLETLNLRNSPVRDITWLHGMDNITDLFLGGTRITDAQIIAYQNSHSGCRIDQGVPT